jgi:hypothetical protein
MLPTDSAIMRVGVWKLFESDVPANSRSIQVSLPLAAPARTPAAFADEAAAGRAHFGATVHAQRSIRGGASYRLGKID